MPRSRRTPLPLHPPAAHDAPWSRRDFVSSGTMAMLGAALASGCGDGFISTGPGAPSGSAIPPAGSVSFAGGVVQVNLDAAPALSAPNGYLIIGVGDSAGRRADVIVLNLGADGYRAFSSICTHEGCTVTSFANDRILCPCHGSEFNRSGAPVAGPAPRALANYPAALDAARNVVNITVA